MTIQSTGSLKFIGKSKKIFIFEKDNYDEHCLKHSALKLEYYLQDVEKTLQDPDCIASGPQRNKETYYRVLGEVGKENIHILKIPFFASSRVYYIASAHDFWTSPPNVIHYLETPTWRKANFSLF